MKRKIPLLVVFLLLCLFLLASCSGKTAYELAQDAGFEGTEEEWLAALQGKDGASAYEKALANGFVGSEADWLASLKGKDAYALACALGFKGTEEEWLKSLEGEDAYTLAVLRGFEGTEEDWLASLKGKDAYDLACALGYEGTEEDWLRALEGDDAYTLAKQRGFEGTEEEWLESLKGKGAYELACALGYDGSEAEWIASLYGTDGESAYEIARKNGFVGTEREWLASIGDNATFTDQDTRVTLTVSRSAATGTFLLDLRGIYHQENHGGVTYISWGDGTYTQILGKSETEMYHTYVEGGEYTVTLKGLSHIPMVFRKKDVSALTIGSSVTYIADYAFTSNPDLQEVIINATTPPTLGEKARPFEAAQVSTDKSVPVIIRVPEESLLSYYMNEAWSKQYTYALRGKELVSTLFGDLCVTVGEGGDFTTINDALKYLSVFYPVYESRGLKCEVKILAGTVICEQIFVDQIDLSYITITTDAANNTVYVDVTGWGGVSHDTRGNRPFFSGENGARLPAIGCLFSCITPKEGWNTSNQAVGYYCNRGSSGVVCGYLINVGGAETPANVGFENFYDNILANNNSEITLRDAIARGAKRYGVHARHLSRVSARSADITNCGDTAAYADRVSTLDVREADLSGSLYAIVAYNASTVTANGTHANNVAFGAFSGQGSVLNCDAIQFDGVIYAFVVLEGGTLITSGAIVTNCTGRLYNQTPNTVTANGIIYG